MQNNKIKNEDKKSERMRKTLFTRQPNKIIMVHECQI